MKQIFTETLPFKDGKGANRGKKVIDWVNSIGCKVKFVYDDIEGEVEIVDYKEGKLYIKYLDYDIFIAETGKFLKGQLGILLNKHTSNYKYKIGDIIKTDKMNITILNRWKNKDKKYSPKYYDYKCNICGYDRGTKTEHQILNNLTSCPCCTNQIVVEGINDILTTAPFMVSLGISEEMAKKYTSKSKAKIDLICPDCGTKNSIYIYNLCERKSIGCICGDGKSYISKYLNNTLKQLNILFKTEIFFDWCVYFNSYKNKKSKGIYDFVIEDLKLIIETDGAFHRNNNLMNGQTIEESQFIDSEKDRLASENGYKVIRISDEGDIKENILNSELAIIFDLSEINWLEAEEFALKNIAKEVCVFKNNNPELSVKEIADTFGVSTNPIYSYLKKGTKLGWCNYNPEEEKSKGRLKARKKRSVKNG